MRELVLKMSCQRVRKAGQAYVASGDLADKARSKVNFGSQVHSSHPESPRRPSA
ncbi:MAG: hypothetical protein H7Y33_17270 [Cytophagales bacterium]|nr:hypothetical protein [Rhizobacter sp.]